MAGLYTRPRYGLFKRKEKPMANVYGGPEAAEPDPGYEDDFEPYQCTECGRWTEHGIVSELDDEFVCDECLLDLPQRYGGDCV